MRPKQLQDVQRREALQRTGVFGFRLSMLTPFWQPTKRFPGAGADALASPDYRGRHTCVARQMRQKAAGLDGICLSWLALLPIDTHTRLAQLLRIFENHGTFPEAMCRWKIAALPKKRQGAMPSLGEIRPVAVGSAIYRMWGRVRLGHLAAALAQYVGQNQAGGIGGEDVSSLLLRWTLLRLYLVLDRLGLPAPVLQLLKAQRQQ